ncbi:hypothetical protein CBX60_23490 [Salmonella enterica subsp. enterica serovar Pensacola]|nr:hypothetical protein [Salmonella enterica]ECT8867508.1 hypothetical protein [Salmonella enterica subsp. enterica serovar Pensacola]
MVFSVKKIVLAVVVCSSFAGASPVMADTGNPTLVAGQKVSAITMHVIGTISKSTCDIRPYTAAGADATTLNMGVVNKGEAGTPVSFFLKPVDGCSDGITNGGSAEITWESSGLTEHGISNMYGTAKNVHIELSPMNGDGVAVPDTTGVVKTGAQTVVYGGIAAGDPSTPQPFKYEVKLVPDSGDKLTEAGTVDTDMSYTVAYK